MILRIIIHYLRLLILGEKYSWTALSMNCSGGTEVRVLEGSPGFRIERVVSVSKRKNNVISVRFECRVRVNSNFETVTKTQESEEYEFGLGFQIF